MTDAVVDLIRRLGVAENACRTACYQTADKESQLFDLMAGVIADASRELQAYSAIQKGESVPLPVNEWQAELMAKIGCMWLTQYAPHRLERTPIITRNKTEDSGMHHCGAVDKSSPAPP